MWDQIIRLARHRWMEDAHRLVEPAVLQRLRQQVSDAEALHTGEIRICIEAALPNSYLVRPGSLRTITRQRALAQFGKLRVWDTEHNNGVLIYLLLAERSIDFVADRGLNALVPAQHWKAMLESLAKFLREGRFEEGLSTAIKELSDLLEAHFPLAPNQVRPNELPDQPRLV